MKICYFEYQNKRMFGQVKENSILPFDSSESLFDLTDPVKTIEALDVAGVKLLLPVTPSKIVCVGRNYSEHAKELGNEVPKEPLLFLKAPSSLIVSGENITIPKQSKQVEHEGELGLIISRTCKNLNECDDWSKYVYGYICLNDVTARDLQRKDVQFTRAKSFDTFCPVSALIETDFDASNVQVITKVNGEIRQDGRTSEMVFPISFLVRYISNQMTLTAGDIIATGTPSGVSKLMPGDICEVEIEGLGSVTNFVEEQLDV